MLSSFLFQIPDHRRKQGQRYQLGPILLFSIFAILSGATSYRKIHSFIKIRYPLLDEQFNLNWKRIPAYSAVRKIIQGVSSEVLEQCFRSYNQTLLNSDSQREHICFDGKVLRGSFNAFEDKKAVQILSAFLTNDDLILAHHEIDCKTNEIPTAQSLIEELGLKDCLFTFDAMHCQKKHLKSL